MTIQQKTKTCQQKPAEFFPQAIGPVSPAFSQVALLAGPFLFGGQNDFRRIFLDGLFRMGRRVYRCRDGHCCQR